MTSISFESDSKWQEDERKSAMLSGKQRPATMPTVGANFPPANNNSALGNNANAPGNNFVFASVAQGGGIPSFDSFGADYRTPFDSPEVIAMSQIQPEQAPSNSVQSLPPNSLPVLSPRNTRPRAFSMDEISALSIFHTAAPSSSSSKAKPAADKASKSSANTPTHKSKKHADSDWKEIESQPEGKPSADAALPSSGGVDAVSDGFIPDIVFFEAANLHRRASEPTLGTRRLNAARAAAAAAASEKQQQSGSKSSTPRSAAAAASAGGSDYGSKRPSRLDINDKLSTPAASDINRVGPFQSVTSGPLTPKRGCVACSNVAFASNLCALHLAQPALATKPDQQPLTPTGVIRRLVSMWRRTSRNVPNLTFKLRWSFWKKGEYYIVELWQDRVTLERTVMVNGTVNYRGVSEDPNWRLSMVLGASKSSAFEAILGSVPRVNHANETSDWCYEGEYEYELWVDGFPFLEAQNNWLSELGSTQLQQQESLEESGEDGGAAYPNWINASNEEGQSKPIPLAHQQHYNTLKYIQKHWSREVDQVKTSLGYPKNIVKWRFTIQGEPHTITVTHSERSGKRRIESDGRTILVKKPSFINGMLFKRTATHVMKLGDVELEVRIQKRPHSALLSYDGYTATAASASSSASAASPHSAMSEFSYDFFIDHVPYQRCIRTLIELAGGMFDVEQKLALQNKEEQRRKLREIQRRKDPRIELSPNGEDD